MIYPKALKKGDKVGIIAPAGVIKRERIDGGIKAVENMGLVPVVGKSVYEEYGYFAGNDHIRSDDINHMFMDKDIKGIFCGRGGYGCQRLVDLIDWESIKKNPKVFAGYSDVTTLHYLINERCKFVTYHSPMVFTDFYKEDLDKSTKNSFINSVFENENNFVDEIKAKPMFDAKGGGFLAGGNLSMVTSSIGTDYEMDFTDKIVFLEEIGEEIYKIDKMFNQLKNSGSLGKAQGFILGHFFYRSDNMDLEYEKTVRKVIESYLLPYEKSVIYDYPCGHKYPNLTLPLGAYTKIDGNQVSFL